MPPPDAPPLLELDHVTVRRGPVRILDRLSLRIPADSTTVILGPNGSGKTSLLKVLLRQFYPSVEPDHTGTVKILGRHDWPVDQLRRQMGVVSSELDAEFSAGRAGRMTALQAVLSGYSGVRLADAIGRPDAANREAAEQALQRVGVAHLASRQLQTMSTGQRRRTLIARALVHRPRALVLDEPTTGLDIAARHGFLEQIQKLASAGTVLLLVTHHVEEIVPAIERVVFLDQGRIHSEGNRREMLRSDALSRLFGIPLELRHDGSGRPRLQYR